MFVSTHGLDDGTRSATVPTRGIVTISDAGFFPGALALVKSIRHNMQAAVTVLDQGLTPDQVNELAALGVDVRHAPRCIPIDNERFGCCYAFFDIDAAPYDTILYIDADMLVLEDISELFEVIEKKGVVSSGASPNKYLENRHHLSSITGLIVGLGRKEFVADFRREFGGVRGLLRQLLHDKVNTGIVGFRRDVLLTVKARIPAYGKYFTRLKHPDQDLLSLVLADRGIRYHRLDYVYNATRLHGNPQTTNRQRRWMRIFHESIVVRFTEGRCAIVENRNRRGLQFNNTPIKALHYNSSEKPWIPGVTLRDGFKEIWEFYFRLAVPADGLPARADSTDSGRS